MSRIGPLGAAVSAIPDTETGQTQDERDEMRLKRLGDGWTGTLCCPVQEASATD